MSFLSSRLPPRDFTHRRLKSIATSSRTVPSSPQRQLCLSPDGRHAVPPEEVFHLLSDVAPRPTVSTSAPSTRRQTLLTCYNFNVFPSLRRHRAPPPLSTLLTRLRSPDRRIHTLSSNSHNHAHHHDRLKRRRRPTCPRRRKQLRYKKTVGQESARSPSADNPEDPGG